MIRMIRLSVLVWAVSVSPLLGAQAQNAGAPDSRMAPLDQYLMDRDAEIALAKSAAPKAISDAAEVLVLGRQGYKTAVKGTNGFVCLVERSWTDAIDNPEFWNSKRRSPMCLNAAAARTYLPLTIAKTKLVLAGKSKEQMSDAIKAALDKKELPGIERGAVCYMMAKGGHLNDHAGHWHPHVMFYAPIADAKSWGANLPGSPMVAAEDTLDRLTVFMVPVGRWSDGTPDSDHK
jgi:hypothetical protein